MLRDMLFVGLCAVVISSVIIWMEDTWIEAFIGSYLMTLGLVGLATEIYSLPATRERAFMVIGASCIGAVVGSTASMCILEAIAR